MVQPPFRGTRHALAADSGRGPIALPLDRRRARPYQMRVARLSKTSIAVLVAGACLLYAVIHIATIVRSRQVWFDETFFASIAEALMRTGEFDLPISPLWLGTQVYLYGPVYFLIVGSLFELFGIGIVQNRLPGLVFGFALLAVFYFILRGERVRPTVAGLTCALLGLDPTFHQAIHSGRMDSTALFFLLVGLFCLLRSRDAAARAALWWCAGSGAVSAICVLCTPRPGYMLIPIGLILLARWATRRTTDSLWQGIAWGGAFAALYSIWVLYAFGGPFAMAAYYAGFAQTYTGGSSVRFVHMPLLGTIALLAVLVALRDPRRLLSEVAFFSVFSVFGFYYFVKSAPSFGALYASLMIPPAYLAVGVFFSACTEGAADARRIRGVAYAVLAALLLLNGTAFATRTALEVLQWQRRDARVADAAVREMVPAGSRVVGDDQFYFAVLRNGSDFQYIERGGTLEERVAYHRDTYDFDYLITNRDADSPITKAYLDGVPLRKIGDIGAAPTTPLAEAIVNFATRLGLSYSLLSGYEGSVFVRSR